MHCTQKVFADVTYLGASDRRLSLFESAYPVPNGMSYNSYLLDDDKITLFDTADKAVGDAFFENLAYALNGRMLDYLVITHMEPDHCALLGDLLRRCPSVTAVGTAKTRKLVEQFFGACPAFLAVGDGDVLCTGKHTLHFLTAPMVHWPEVLMVYDEADRALYSADAFGTFGALNGNLFADTLGEDGFDFAEARRYYTNIVGKYGVQVQGALKKASAFPFAAICPLHGPIWRQDLDAILQKYRSWATWTAETKGVVIAYASVYGHTQNAAEVLASLLAARGVSGIQLFDVSVTHASYVLAELFRYSHFVLASTTYNNGIFESMDALLHSMQAHNLQNRTAAVIENGSWSPQSGKLMREALAQMKNMRVLDAGVTLLSALKDEQADAMVQLADALASSILTEA